MTRHSNKLGDLGEIGNVALTETKSYRAIYVRKGQRKETPKKLTASTSGSNYLKKEC